MKKITVLFISLTLFLIGLSSIFFALQKADSANITKPDYQVVVNSFSVNFFKGDISKEVLKISPFDDYYYVGPEKQHLVSNENFKQINYNKYWYLNHFYKIFYKDHRFYWSAEGKNDISVNYLFIDNQESGITITRQFEYLPSGVDSIGQSIVVCDDCIVVDDQRRIFINQDTLTDAYSKLIETYELTPVIVNEKLLPSDIQTLTIFDSNLKPKLSFYVEKNQQILYDQKWQLLEVKTPLNFKTRTVTQKVKIH